MKKSTFSETASFRSLWSALLQLAPKSSLDVFFIIDMDLVVPPNQVAEDGAFLLVKVGASAREYKVVWTGHFDDIEEHAAEHISRFSDAEAVFVATHPASKNLGALRHLIKTAGQRARLITPLSAGSGAINTALNEQFLRELDIKFQALTISKGVKGTIYLDVGTPGDISALFPPPGASFTQLMSLILDKRIFPGVLVVEFDLGVSDATAPDFRPLFTVVTRTQGRRNDTLRDVIACLNAQTTDDFEHIIVGHNIDKAARKTLDGIIREQAEHIRSRTRLFSVSGGTRTTPLNFAFEKAKGLITIILDDDDIVFANWLETFAALAAYKPGALLRSVALKQQFNHANVAGIQAPRAVGPMNNEYGDEFNTISQLKGNSTPPVAIAFPQYIFSSLGIRFDEALTTTEDWDFIMRCASIAGVVTTDEITCIYRWWMDVESSRTVHGEDEWRTNHHSIWKKLDNAPYVLGTGETLKLRQFAERHDEVLRWANSLHEENKLMRIMRDYPPRRDMVSSSILSHIFPSHLAQLQSLRRRKKVVLDSGLFDQDWYLAQHPDVASSGMDALSHFVLYGSKELRNPNANFDAKFYYIFHEDVHLAGVEPFFHYVKFGKREGRITRQ